MEEGRKGRKTCEERRQEQRALRRSPSSNRVGRLQLFISSTSIATVVSSLHSLDTSRPFLPYRPVSSLYADPSLPACVAPLSACLDSSRRSSLFMPNRFAAANDQGPCQPEMRRRATSRQAQPGRSLHLLPTRSCSQAPRCTILTLVGRKTQRLRDRTFQCEMRCRSRHLLCRAARAADAGHE